MEFAPWLLYIAANACFQIKLWKVSRNLFNVINTLINISFFNVFSIFLLSFSFRFLPTKLLIPLPSSSLLFNRFLIVINPPFCKYGYSAKSRAAPWSSRIQWADSQWMNGRSSLQSLQLYSNLIFVTPSHSFTAHSNAFKSIERKKLHVSPGGAISVQLAASAARIGCLQSNCGEPGNGEAA